MLEKKHRRSVSLVGAIAFGLACVGTGAEAQTVTYNREVRTTVDGAVKVFHKPTAIPLVPISYDNARHEICPKRFGDVTKRPDPRKLWGCDPGYICDPKNRCIFEPPPDLSFECEPSECVKAPPVISKDQRHFNGKFVINLPYYPADPASFGADWGIYGYAANVQKRDLPTRVHRHVRRQSNDTTSTTEDIPSPTSTDSVEWQQCKEICDVADELGQQRNLELECPLGSPFWEAYDDCRECNAFTNYPIPAAAVAFGAECLELIGTTSIDSQIATTTEPPPDTTTTEDPVTTTDEETTTSPPPDTSSTPTTSVPDSTTTAEVPPTTTTTDDAPPPNTETTSPGPSGEEPPTTAPTTSPTTTVTIVDPETDVFPTESRPMPTITFAPSGRTTVFTSTRYNGSAATITSIIPVGSTASAFMLQFRTIFGALFLALAMFLTL